MQIPENKEQYVSASPSAGGMKLSARLWLCEIEGDSKTTLRLPSTQPPLLPQKIHIDWNVFWCRETDTCAAWVRAAAQIVHVVMQIFPSQFCCQLLLMKREHLCIDRIFLGLRQIWSDMNTFVPLTVVDVSLDVRSHVWRVLHFVFIGGSKEKWPRQCHILGDRK